MAAEEEEIWSGKGGPWSRKDGPASAVWGREAAAVALPSPALSGSSGGGLARSGAIVVGHHGSGGAAEGGGGRTRPICSGRRESGWPRGGGDRKELGPVATERGRSVAIARERGGDGEGTGTRRRPGWGE
jgi:hypothetical protein